MLKLWVGGPYHVQVMGTSTAYCSRIFKTQNWDFLTDSAHKVVQGLCQI